MIRPATSDDVPAMVALIEARRVEYEAYAPVFWRKAEHSAAMSAAFFPMLMSGDRAVALVAEQDSVVKGFMIAVETPAPPVVAPGGPTWTLDDFCVLSPDLWPTVGEALLTEVERIGRERGWRQLVVISGFRDEAKMAWLDGRGLNLTTAWWTTTL